jgi:HD superfamily phosphohydrolase
MTTPFRNSAKVSSITDFVHGQIFFSKLEKSLIATAEFNRLHNILQNSTVYFTYPSNRTSRFNHSLGCAKIAGDIFRCSLLNANRDDAQSFFQFAKKELEEIKATLEFKTDTNIRIRNNTPQSLIEVLDVDTFADPFYNAVAVPELNQNDSCYFVIFLQAIRFVALLHDVGHPPFSHVSENAISKIYEKIVDGDIDADSIDAKNRIQDLKCKLEKFFKQLKSAFHESLGMEISRHLLDEVIASVERTNNGKLTYLMLLIKHLTLRIFEEITPFCAALHRIVDSDLDSDRLDYVLRDMAMSGFPKEPFMLDRLVQSFVLIVDEDAQLNFLPSSRALSSIEDFFNRRFQLYRYVIYHHRVVKFDALLEQCIIKLAERELTSAAPQSEEPGSVALSRSISGLWQILDDDVGSFAHTRISYYIQWDDAWLLSTLRVSYLELSSRNKISPEEAILKNQLSELVSNEKAYFSLFKRVDSFLDVDNAFFEDLAKMPDANWDLLENTFQRGLRSQLRMFRSYVEDRRSKAKDLRQKKVLAGEGLCLTRLLRLIREGCGSSLDGDDFVKSAVIELKKKFKLNDVLFIPKKIKAGLEPEFSLACHDGSIRPLSEMSTVFNDMQKAALVFPPFFVFIDIGSKPNNSAQIEKIRCSLGKLIWKAFDNNIKLTNNKAGGNRK